MQEPIKPYPPYQSNYEVKIEKKYIYAFSEHLGEEELYDDDEPQYKKEVPNPIKLIEDVDLGWLLEQVPKGIDPRQVKIEFGCNYSAMAFEDHYIKFYYEEKTVEKKAEYKAAMKKYEIDLKDYEKKLAVYTEFKKQEKIASLQAELNRLKSE